jgi:hypothetical protein
MSQHSRRAMTRSALAVAGEALAVAERSIPAYWRRATSASQERADTASSQVCNVPRPGLPACDQWVFCG